MWSSSNVSSKAPIRPAGRGRSFAFNAVLAALAVIVYTTQLVVQIGPAAGPRQDFCVYHTGVSLAWTGTSPYDLSAIESQVAVRLGLPPGDQFECGFFLSPLSFVVLAPWGLLPWPVADPAWVATLSLLAIACGSLAWTFGRDPDARGMGWGIVVAAIVLNPLVQRSVSLGQTPLFLCGCVALGQLAFERRWPVLGSLLWAGAGLKPHLALPLLAAAYSLGGWRRVAGIVAVMTAGWFLGAALIGNPVDVFGQYVRFLDSTHGQIGFNQVTNDQVVSWNRLVAAAGGPAFNLRAPLTAVGMVAAGLTLWALHFRGGQRPAGSWVLAAAVIWGPFTTQVNGYELVLLILTVPYLLALYHSRRFLDLAGLLAVLGVISLPRGLVLELGTAIAREEWRPAVLSYRAIALALLAGYTLFRRPLKESCPASPS